MTLVTVVAVKVLRGKKKDDEIQIITKFTVI